MGYRADVGVPAGSDEILGHGVRLAVAREGSGPPVLCLHAIGRGGRDYEAFASLMRHRYEVIRLDWPGQGRSSRDQEPATPARYAELLRGVVGALQLEPPIIIGCSIGGAAAIRYASENPVAGLVLANSGGLIGLTKNTQRASLLFPEFSQPDLAVHGGTKRHSHNFTEAYCPLRPPSINASAL